MKQKNYDADTMFNDYMQSVNADPTAIDDILSGERQPANHGARIKHSTGKMATVTAAAAVVAICAGIGLSNMNANDDSSVKSAANKTATTTTAVTTTQQQKQQTPPKKQEPSFKTEMTEMFASDHSLRVTVKLTALNDEAKKLLDEDAEKYRRGFQVGERENIHVSGVAYKDQIYNIASTTIPVISGNTLTTTLTYQTVNSTDVYKDGDKIKIMFGMNGELEEFEKCPEDRKITVAIKKNMTERVFKSASGKTLWLHDYGFNVGMDAQGMDKYTLQNFEMTFADGTVKTPFNMQCFAGGATRSEKGDPNIMFGFEKKIDKTKVTSIKYAGEVFTPYEQADVTMTCKPIAVSERAFGIEIKLTAGNEQGKKVLKENAEKISSSLCIEKDGMIATAGSFFGADKLSGDSLTLRLFGNIFNKRIDTIPITIKLDSSTPIEVIKALGDKDSAVIFFKKTVDDKVFVSESGEYFWLSDNFATTDHNFSTPKTPDVIFKLKDGTEVSTRDIGLTSGGNTGNDKIKKQHTFVFDGKFPKGTDNVVSITYDGIEFTAQ